MESPSYILHMVRLVRDGFLYFTYYISPISWNPLPSGILNLNFDGSSHGNAWYASIMELPSVIGLTLLMFSDLAGGHVV